MGHLNFLKFDSKYPDCFIDKKSVSKIWSKVSFNDNCHHKIKGVHVDLDLIKTASASRLSHTLNLRKFILKFNYLLIKKQLNQLLK